MIYEGSLLFYVFDTLFYTLIYNFLTLSFCFNFLSFIFPNKIHLHKFITDSVFLLHTVTL